MFLSLDNDLVEKVIADPMYARGFVPMVVNDQDVTLVYHSGECAYHISYDYLMSITREIDILPGSPVFFQFGAVDIAHHLKKYNNVGVVVECYVKGCLLFSQKYNLKPIFIQPFTDMKHKKYNLEFEQTLRSECERLNLDPPIELFGSFINRKYPSEPNDKLGHLTYKKNSELLKLLVSNVY